MRKVTPIAGSPASKTVGGDQLAGIRPTNSNTRVSAAKLGAQAKGVVVNPGSPANMGLNSDRLRDAMVERLVRQGITDERVLQSMRQVHRHAFVDEALASRAYEDAALPIGHSQTISQPWVVARMLSALCEKAVPKRVLEVGTGCGYQAAVMAGIFREVYSIERVRALYDMARQTLRALGYQRIKLSFGDGMAGWPAAAPFGGIVVAAAGLEIPQTLMQQLEIGGRLIAPEGGSSQKLVLIERTGVQSWNRTELEPVRFVPLKAGVQS